MPFDINNFVQNIAEFDVVITNKFDITITLPTALQNLLAQSDTDYPNLAQWDQINPLRAVSCSTPGVATVDHETHKLGVGPKIKQAYNAAMTPIRVVFLADAQGIIEETLTLWLNFRFQYSFDSSGLSTFMANYRSQVTSPMISINKYDRRGNIVNNYKIVGAVPTILSNQKLDWDAKNSISYLNVTFDYVSYSLN